MKNVLKLYSWPLLAWKLFLGAAMIEDSSKNQKYTWYKLIYSKGKKEKQRKKMKSNFFFLNKIIHCPGKAALVKTWKGSQIEKYYIQYLSCILYITISNSLNPLEKSQVQSMPLKCTFTKGKDIKLSRHPSLIVYDKLASLMRLWTRTIKSSRLKRTD